MLNSKPFFSKKWLLPLLVALAGCDGGNQENASSTALAFHSGDECHICGMVITDFPGPKGAALAQGEVKKFCSVAEMMGWWLQEENQTAHPKLYVHDMAKGSWSKPDDAALIDATQAHYVVGSRMKGAMGATIASFSTAQDASQFAAEQGGTVMGFQEIDLATLQGAPHDHEPALAH